MRKAKVMPITLMILGCFSILLVACGSAEPDASSTLPAEQTQVVVTPITELTTPATDETPDEAEAEPVETPTSSGLTAVIISGDTAGVGKPFTFDATQSRPGERDIVNYVWTLGDGTTMFGISVEHAYSEPGSYTVNLIITDEAGQTDAEAKVVEIVELDELATPTAAGQFAIVGTIWELDNAMRGTIVTLAFDEETLSGSAGCNDYAASHTITLNVGTTAAISISSISATSDSCTVEVMAQERGYLDSLASARTITVEGNKLIMETGAGTLTFSEASN